MLYYKYGHFFVIYKLPYTRNILKNQLLAIGKIYSFGGTRHYPSNNDDSYEYHHYHHSPLLCARPCAERFTTATHVTFPVVL